jgi:hypothetical protein
MPYRRDAHKVLSLATGSVPKQNLEFPFRCALWMRIRCCYSEHIEGERLLGLQERLRYPIFIWRAETLPGRVGSHERGIRLAYPREAVRLFAAQL